jgi:hypothetical protein
MQHSKIPNEKFEVESRKKCFKIKKEILKYHNKISKCKILY